MRHLSLAVLALTLAACSLDPRHTDTPSLPLPTHFSVDPRFVAVSATPGQEPPWWQGFHDAELDALEQHLQGNQDLVAQLHHVEQTQALLQGQQATLWPQLDLAAGASNQQLSRTRATYYPGFPYRYTDQQLALALSWEPDVFGRLHDEIRIAHSLWRADEDDLHALRLSLQAELAQAYIGLLADHQMQVLLQAQVADSRRYAELVRSDFEHGATVISAVDAAASAADADRQNLDQLNADIAVQEHAIALLLGHAAGSFQPKLAAQLPNVQMRDRLPASVLARRPDVARARHLLQVAEAQIGLARTAYFPRFQLSAGAGFESGSPQDLFDVPSELWSLGASSLVTLFDAGQRKALNAQARAAYEESVARYRQSALNALREAEDARRRLASSLTRRDLQTHRSALADEQATQVDGAVQAGMSSDLDLLQARLQARQSHIDLIQLQSLSLSDDIAWLVAIE